MLTDTLMPLRQYGDLLFGFREMYASTGGGGLESKLYKHLVNLVEHTDGELLYEKDYPVNDRMIGVKFYKHNENLYSFTLSHYFKNSYQMQFYNPSSMGASLQEVKRKLLHYITQVDEDAEAKLNPNF